MDPVAEEAFSELAGALGSLLPPPADPDLAPEVTINPVRVRPSGLGGYVGPHADPDGDVVGRFLEAKALVEVKATSLAGLDAAVGTVTRALVGAAGTTSGRRASSGSSSTRSARRRRRRTGPTAPRRRSPSPSPTSS